MSTNKLIEQAIFGGLIDPKFLKLLKTLEPMKCSTHGDQIVWNIKYMFEAYQDESKIHFKVTEKCCCEEFKLKLESTAHAVLYDE